MSKKSKPKAVAPTSAEPKKSKSPKLEYHLEISVNDVVFKTEAESLLHALVDFAQSPVFPFGAKTKAILVYGKGDTTRRRIWQTPVARRMLTTIARKPAAINLLAEELTRSLNE